MKTKLTLLFLLIILIFSNNVSFAQRSYEMELLNLVQINETEFRFDVRLRNTAADPVTDFIAVEMMQFQVAFNTGLFNGGAFNNSFLLYVSGTTDLNAAVISPITPVSSNVTTDQTVIQWVTQPLGESAYAIMIDHNNWIKVGTFRAVLKSASSSTNSKNFASVLPNLTLVPPGCLCNWCDVDYDLYGDGGYSRAAGAAPNLITNKILTNSTINKTFFSHVFTGTGFYSDGSRWNNSVHSSDPSYHIVPTVVTNNISIGALSQAPIPIIIPGYCALTDNHTVNDITISSNSTLTLNPATQFTVNGTLYKDNSSTAALTLKSTVFGTASLIHSTPGITGTTERYISGDPWSWHLLSSPVASQAISDNFTPTGDGNDYDFYTWYEPSLLWVNFKNTTTEPTWNDANGNTSFTPGKGYLVAYEAAGTTKTYAGTLNSGPVSYALSHTGNGTYQQYNLLGNPFPCSIDWKAVSGWDRTNLSGTDKSVWVWNDAVGNYGTYSTADAGNAGTNNVTRYITSGQGFFVLASASGSLLMDNGIKAHSSQAFLKNSGSITEELRLRLTCETNTYSDEALIAFNNSDPESGAEKFMSMYPQAPELWSVKNGSDYSINFMGSFNTEKVVPLTVKVGSVGEYSITASQVESFGEYQIVTLEDRYATAFINLGTTPAYTFQVNNTGTISDRFFLHFLETTSLSPLSAAKDFNIYAFNGIITVQSLQKSGGKITITDMAGRKVAIDQVKGGSTTQINMQAHPGIYYVCVLTSKGITNTKLYVK